MISTDVKTTEYDPYFGRYIAKVPTNTCLRDSIKAGKTEVIDFFNGIPEEKLLHRYADGKWTILEVFQHLIDTERIFTYRAFRIARGDKTPLSGFDQDIYIEPSRANQKGLSDLLTEFEAVRAASISLIDSLSDEDLCQVGISSQKLMSARAATFVIIGHFIWHKEIIEERYLNKQPLSV